MAPSVPDMPPDPIIRFRLRTLLVATTALAMLAAIAGPYYRSVSPEVQRRLLVLWSFLLVGIVASLYLRLRDAVQRAENGAVRFVVFQSNTWSTGRRPILFLVGLIGIAVLLVTSTLMMSHERSLKSVGHFVFVTGSGTAGLIFGFIRRPLYLCEDGIPIAKGHLVPWKYIRNATWVAGTGNKMKLRRYDGDVYLEVPPTIRDEVEAFIREKIGADVVAAATT